MSAAPLPEADKWCLFDELRVARVAFGVSDRDLTVLNALLSFLPGRNLADSDDLIVFPSNASLSERAHGMPESTLRRHLAALIDAGLIARHDSPNGKRYARRDRGGAMLHAFGFSLRPLLVRASEITDAAATAREAALQLSLAREAAVLHLRDLTKLMAWAAAEGRLDEASPEAERLNDMRRKLRRKLDHAEIEGLCKDAACLLRELQTLLQFAVSTPEMSGCDSQNERHQQNTNPDSQESEPRNETALAESASEPRLPLSLVLKACPEISVYARWPISSWSDLVASADYVHPMMGIGTETWHESRRIMGPEQAAIALAAMLERIGQIRNPGGYLRSLNGKAASGQFKSAPMIMALLTPANRRAA